MESNINTLQTRLIFNIQKPVGVFYQPGVRLAGPKIVFMFSVCLYVCVFVRKYHVR